MCYCIHCLWDIRQDADGIWRLAWSHIDDDVDPYWCEVNPKGHEPND